MRSNCLMNQTSQIEAPIDPRPSLATPALSRRAITIWLLQLVFPTIALLHVFLWIIDPFPLGRFGVLVLVFGLCWYGACFLVLALRPGRRWIEAHPVLLVVLYVLFATGLVAAEWKSRITPATDFDPRAPHITEVSPELGWRYTPGAGDIGDHGCASRSTRVPRARVTFALCASATRRPMARAAPGETHGQLNWKPSLTRMPTGRGHTESPRC